MNPPAFDWAALGLLVGLAAVVVVVVFAATLVVARAAGRHSVVDVTWGLGFVVIAVAAYVATGIAGVGDPTARLVALVLPGLWGLRLAVYIGWRNHGKGEDPRYAEMLGDDHAPGAVTATVLRKVYLPQTLTMLVVTLPVLAAMVRAETVPAVLVVGAAHPAALVTVVGPLLMSYLLISVTGKELTEKSMSDRPGYADYVERTSGFVPLPPGSRAARAT